MKFVSFVLDDMQATWTRLLPQMGSQYRVAKLVLFRDMMQSACGTAQSASGPFYCPLDRKAYIDLGFYDELQQRRPDIAKQLSVRLELQADCFAGVWANSTEQRQILDKGDIAEGLNAAAAIDDDRLQRMSTGTVHPESFTHGSSAQRVTWFKRGFTTGRPDNCDTFAGGT